MSDRISAEQQREGLLRSLQQPEGDFHVEKPDTVSQQLAAGKADGSKKNANKPRGAKWPLDPPPVLSFEDPDNPTVFMMASCEKQETDGSWTETDALWGDRAASLYKMKLQNDSNCMTP
jgi:hypothetical protein